jgi:hypothetical protein
MSPVYGNVKRELGLAERLSRFADSCAVGNLCLFWRLGAGVDFSVSEEKYNQIIQEKRRVYAYKGPFIYDPKPLAVWTNFADRKPANYSKHTNRMWRASEINACNEILHMIESQGLKESIDRASLRYFIKNSSSVFSLVSSRGFAEKKQIIKNIALKWMC